jgi:hypothetical protein
MNTLREHQHEDEFKNEHANEIFLSFINENYPKDENKRTNENDHVNENEQT